MDKVSEFIKNVKNCLNKDHSPNKDEFNHFSLVFKQVFALILGIGLGLMGIKGIIGILIFLAVSNGLMMYYSKNYLQIDEEEIENHKVFTESTFPSLALFILCWTVTYTAVHYSK